MVGLYNLLTCKLLKFRVGCWNQPNRWVVCLLLELPLWTLRPKSKSSRSPWVECGCGGYEKSRSFVQVGEIFEKTGCCQLPFEWLVDCKCSITGQFEPLNPSFVKTPSMFFLLYFYLDTSCSQLIWQILFQMVWKLKLPSIFQISPNIIYPDVSWIVLDHHCQSQASIRFLAAWDEDAQGEGGCSSKSAGEILW